MSTRALTPRIWLVMAAFFSLLGAFIGTKVASTVGKGLIAPPSGAVGLLIVGSALVGATTWNLLTWWKGLPSSSSHALFGGMGGAALAAGAPVLWNGVLTKIIVPMVLSPVVGLILGYFVMTLILWLFRGQHPGRTSRGFRYAQTFSAAAMALGHGLQDAGKTMGIIVLALTVGGYQHDSSIPNWVKASTASILYVAGLTFGAPISTTHTITSTIMGVGATKRLSAVRWGVAGNIVSGWILTFPGAGVVAALAYALTIPFQ